MNQNWDYVCFTDNNDMIAKKQIGIWEIRPLKFNKLDNVKNSRWHKLHPHVLFPKHAQSIWIDSNIDILTPYLFNLIEKRDAVFLVPYHFCRTCIYDECDAVLLCKKDTVENVSKIRNILEQQKMPVNYGLNESNILFRKHLETKKIMSEWWYYIENYTKRDQLSFSMILWKNNIKVDDISFENARFDYKNFEMVLHKGEK